MNNPGAYQEQERSPDSVRALVEKHAPLVKRIALHLHARLPESVLLDDLLQAGIEGLLEAANSYQQGKGASFETFAGIRIKGAMLDEMRRGDWSPRSVHRASRRMAQVQHALEAKLGRSPNVEEMAEAMEVPVDEFRKMARHSLSARLVSLDEPVGEEGGNDRSDFVQDEGDTPDQLVEKDNLRARLVEAIKSLPERDQILLNLYYFEELNLREIGAVLGVSESRVSQLHSLAASKLRGLLEEG